MIRLRLNIILCSGLSGLIGGTFTYLFPNTGLFGLRFLSILFTMSTIFIVYNMLKPYLNRTNLKIGLLLVTLCVCHNPKIFHYNFLSILLYSATASLLFSGLKKDKWWLFLLSGAMVGLDVFSRLPSLVNLGLVLAIAFYGYLSKTSFKKIATPGNLVWCRICAFSNSRDTTDQNDGTVGYICQRF